MEHAKLSAEELRALDKKRLQEIEVDIRRRKQELRLDIYAEKGKHLKESRGLKKSLARLKTVFCEKTSK